MSTSAAGARCGEGRILAGAAIVAALSLLLSGGAQAAEDLVFSGLDGSSADLDERADGVWTVRGDLVLTATLRCGGGAQARCSMRIQVSGDALLEPGASIEAPLGLRLEVAGDLTLREGTSLVVERGELVVTAHGRFQVHGLVMAGRPESVAGPDASISLRALGPPGYPVHIGTTGTVVAAGHSQAGRQSSGGQRLRSRGHGVGGVGRRRFPRPRESPLMRPFEH